MWRKVPDIPYSARGDATCVQIGGRHVLSMFGKDIWGLTQDPAPNGMLIFDLVAMQWRDSYDAAAGEYERPSDLKTWYTNGYVPSLCFLFFFCYVGIAECGSDDGP